MCVLIMVWSRWAFSGIDVFDNYSYPDSMLDMLNHVDENSLAPYPERHQQSEGKIERFAARLAWEAMRPFWPRLSHFKTIVSRVEQEQRLLGHEADERLTEIAAELRRDIRREGLTQNMAAQSFALIREAIKRCTGLQLFPVQLIGGYILLNGYVAEMATGEGKTLTATLPAATAALAGLPVHVVTVNDYLVERDHTLTAPIYGLLGLSSAAVVHDMKPEERRAAYSQDITYCNNKELAFDYLRDRLVLGREVSPSQLRLERLYRNNPRTERLVLRGLYFAIVDEVDSVLIDEARTPLIISGSGNTSYEEDLYQQALELTQTLDPNHDFTIEKWQHLIRLTEDGKSRIAKMGEALGGVWAARRSREELVTKALTARYIYTRDKQYIVSQDKVQIVDEFTGRVMADRSWEGGLHQLIEAKESCPLTAQRVTKAKITYQRFFRRYLHLAGMSGTVQEVSRELWNVYKLRTVVVPTNRKISRTILPQQVHESAKNKWQAIVEEVVELHKQDRPVLIGTRSVAASEHLSGLLKDAGITHRVLNARQDHEEAGIVACAGELGSVTVATNMAGRGTDIRLDAGVEALGGLHVMLTERHESKRIDRQLFGRCARQGDRGSCHAIISLEDELITSFLSRRPGFTALLRWYSGPWHGLVKALIADIAQRLAEHRSFEIRSETMRLDEKLDAMLAFSGRTE
jgi:preprotein translocase subunit SecA